ncbi:sulfite exporter TauE/SafE family protein [Roseibium sp. RKSG952]|uniref:sulfite exporter TauE/SafE family protein n=1 Tax=Roseibium sp. RKSG952 TaxID=2529384 RepID=UPI0012BBCCE4|nr:sulfite exporter TauE/SafE family protein [Roseibium sp. RKSG952]MTH99306.1 sulfite exporter TauE/SafE family protein [Roseibium sp. RKSG952]
MAAWLSSILPGDIPVWASLALVLASFFTSAMTAAMGLGGGITLTIIMAFFVPANALVPVHGAVQLGSNAGRVFVQWTYVDWLIVGYFAVGAFFGAAIGGAVAVNLPPDFIRTGIALMVLWVVWGNPPKLKQTSKPVVGIAGFLATLLSMFFAATGPISGSALSMLGLTHFRFVANQAATAGVMHVLKIVAFGLFGFAFAPWVGLIALMIASGLLGTLAGSKLLGRLDETAFKRGFRWGMTALAGVLISEVLYSLSG